MVGDNTEGFPKGKPSFYQDFSQAPNRRLKLGQEKSRKPRRNQDLRRCAGLDSNQGPTA